MPGPSAAAATAETLADDSASGAHSMYPPKRSPSTAAIRQVLTNADTQCPVSHRTYNFGKYHKCLEAGWFVKYSPVDAKVAFNVTIVALKDRGGLGAKSAASASAAVGLMAKAPAAVTPAAPVPAKVSGEAAEIAAAAAEVTDEVSLTDDEASLVESSGIMSQEALARKAPWTPWRPD